MRQTNAEAQGGPPGRCTSPRRPSRTTSEGGGSLMPEAKRMPCGEIAQSISASVEQCEASSPEHPALLVLGDAKPFGRDTEPEAR